MVFPDDARWQADLRSSGLRYANSARWRSWGNEELLIRLVRKNMPWLRSIIILLARESQRKPWMDGVRVVYHREFIPKSLLPVFNVNTIEMFLHKIPDLSERFIYGNDDMFPLGKLSEEDFFVGNVPCQHMEERPMPPQMNVFHLFVREGLNMIAAEYGYRFTETYLSGGHSIAPILKSTIEEVWRKHGGRIRESFTEQRSPDNFNQYIFSYYQHFSGNFIDHVPRRSYTSVKIMPAEDVVKMIESPRAGIVCINDNGNLSDCDEYARVVKEALLSRLAGK